MNLKNNTILLILLLIQASNSSSMNFFSTVKNEESKKNNQKKVSTETNEKAMSCTICLEDDTNRLVTLACHHEHHFHAPCIRGWIQNNNTCPICRVPIALNNNYRNSNDPDVNYIYNYLYGNRFDSNYSYNKYNNYQPTNIPSYSYSNQYNQTNSPIYDQSNDNYSNQYNQNNYPSYPQSHHTNNSSNDADNITRNNHNRRNNNSKQFNNSSEFFTAFFVSLTGNYIYEKTNKQNHKNNRSAFAMILGLFGVSNLMLNKINPKRSEHPEKVASNWLLGTACGFITQKIISKIGNKK